MRKMFLAMVLVLMLATGTAFAWMDSSATATGGNSSLINIGPQSGTWNTPTNNVLSPTATGGAGGAGGNVTISPNAIKNTVETDIGIGNIGGFSMGNKTFSPSSDQKQKQQQGQIQGQQQQQGQNNEQVIAPSQSIVIEAQKQNLIGLPSLGSVPELNFGNGKMTDATGLLPNFAIYGIKPLKSESVSEVLSVNANVKFKKLYAAILTDAKAVASNGSKTLTDVRYQVIRAEAQKSWNTGGSIGGGASGLANNGLGGGSGAGSLVPSFGGTKADDLFTIIFVKVMP